MVNSTEYSVKTKKEVILSAGTIQTPQLLELSGELAIYHSKRESANRLNIGIGNRTLLKSVNITTLIDLPGVGENLQVGSETPSPI